MIATIFLFNSFEPTFCKNCVTYLAILYGGVICAVWYYTNHNEIHHAFILGYFCTIYILRTMQLVNIESLQNFVSK